MEFKQLIFVSGKGGTGKSTVATLLTHHLAQSGKRVLLAEMEKKSSIKALADLQNRPQYQPSPSGLGFDWCLLQGLDCLVEYVSSFTRLESLTQKFFESPLLKTLINVAPGLNDLSTLGKLTSSFRKHGPGFNYDHIIVDAPSTGSFHSLIKAPATLGQSVSRGPLHSQSLSIDEVLKNSQFVQYFFVTLFEELPMDELEDTLSQFKDKYGEQIVVVGNKNIPLEKSELESGAWAQLLNQKTKEQTRQVNRLKSLWEKRFSVNLMTKSLPQFLREKTEEVLRPI